MVKVTFYSDFGQMMEAEHRAREAADARVTAEHKKYRIGDIVVSDSGYGFPIFHEILDIEKIVRENLEKYGQEYEQEGIYQLDSYCFTPEMLFYRFANNYSEVVPEGEPGDFHISVGIGRISREHFDELKARGFRNGDAP